MSSRIVVVTGASRGIGRSIVDRIFDLEPNSVVYGVARSKDHLNLLAQKYGSKFQSVEGDVTDSSLMQRLLHRLEKEQSGRLDAIVANAGILEPVQDVNNIDAEAWKRLFDVNYFSIVELTGLLLPLLSHSRGNLICVSSGASVKSYHGWGAYGSSKAALNHFCMTVAAEAAPVRAVAIAPGVVDTQMQVDIREKFGPKGGMSASTLQRFLDLKANNELLDPAVPATVYARLAINGIPAEINGQYLRYNDERLASV